LPRITPSEATEDSNHQQPPSSNGLRRSTGAWRGMPATVRPWWRGVKAFSAAIPPNPRELLEGSDLGFLLRSVQAPAPPDSRPAFADVKARRVAPTPRRGAGGLDIDEAQGGRLILPVPVLTRCKISPARISNGAIAILEIAGAQVFAPEWRSLDHATHNIHTHRHRNCSPAIPALPCGACTHRPFPFDYLAPRAAGCVSAPSANFTKRGRLGRGGSGRVDAVED
jgi:hypothetical protein